MNHARDRPSEQAPKRQLPVITAIIYTDDTGKQSVLGAAVGEPEVSGIARASAAPIASGNAVLALYEPAVPRCNACNCFAPLTAGDKALCSLHSRVQPHYIPADGSGYCHEHAEARQP